MTKYRTDVRITTTIEFEDNGTDDLRDQAIEAAMSHAVSPYNDDLEIIGSILAVEADGI